MGLLPLWLVVVVSGGGFEGAGVPSLATGAADSARLLIAVGFILISGMFDARREMY